MFEQLKGELNLREGVLHRNDKPIDFSRDPEIVDLVNLLNQHPDICTFTSCQGHFRLSLIKYKEQVEVFKFTESNDDFYFKRYQDPRVYQFSQEFPELDIENQDFMYQRGWVRILSGSSEASNNLISRLKAYVCSVSGLSYDKEFEASEDDLIVELAPEKVNCTRIVGNVYFGISWHEVLALDRERKDSIAKLTEWAESIT